MGFETMIDPPAAARGAAAQVTASQLVRNFGVWQERAGRAPVFIRHRGRAKLVLSSVEQVELWRAGASREPTPPPVETLLNGFTVPMLLVSHTGAVIAANSAAQSFQADTGLWLDALQTAIASVARHGIAERLLTRLGDQSGVFEITLQPWLGQVLVRIDNGSLSQLLQDRGHALDALRHALDQVAPDVAAARLTPRGFLAEPAPSLAAMTRLDGHAIANTRFIGMIDVASRVAVGEAIDQSFRHGGPARVDALLRVNRADPVHVAIGLAPIYEAAAIAALQVVIARRAASGLIHS